MISAFGVDHGAEVSKKFGSGMSAGKLKGLLSPYKGATPKAATTGTNRPLENLMAPYKGAMPQRNKTVAQLDPANRPLTMKLRSKRRNAAFGRQPRPGEAMR